MKRLLTEMSKLKNTSINISKDIVVTRTKINKYNYTSISFNDINNKLTKVFINELDNIIKKNHINNDNVLIIGVGNDKSTPDSLGPLVVSNIITTTKVKKFIPGVSASTGITTKELVKSISKLVNPSLIIIIDSLKSYSYYKLNRVIEITDEGLSPGSAFGSKSKINKSSLKIPVISIGVPTVCDISTIVNEFGYIIKDIPEMLVTTKDIDYYIDKLSLFLSISLNKYFLSK